ncbi:hypothetical protein ACHAP3_006778 [Botrytis cinerea]
MSENTTPKKNAGSGHKPASSSPPGAPKKQTGGSYNYTGHKASRDPSPSARASEGSQRKDKK